MNKLALVLPFGTGSAYINDNISITACSGFAKLSLGCIITGISSVAIYIGGFMMFVWLVWGVFQYIIAEGNKENLAKARARIRWALLGFLILILAFLASDAYREVLAPVFPMVQEVSDPTKPIEQPASGERQIKDIFGFGDINSLGIGLDRIIPLVFSLAAILVVFYFLLGAFELIYSQGDKNAVASAQAKITHAIIGLVLLILLFLVLQYLPEAIGLSGFKIIGP